MESPYISGTMLCAIDLATGIAKITISIKEEYYYKMLSEMTGQKVENEYDLMGMLKELADMKQEYSKVLVAMQQVRNTGYGVVMPEQEEIVLDAPELIKHGNKYGVKMKDCADCRNKRSGRGFNKLYKSCR